MPTGVEDLQSAEASHAPIPVETGKRRSEVHDLLPLVVRLLRCPADGPIAEIRLTLLRRLMKLSS